MISDHSDFRLNKAKELGFEICNNGKEDIKAKAQKIFGGAISALGETCDVDIYIDAAGADGIIETYQSMGKVNSRMVVVAVKAGLRPIDVLAMTYGQHAIIGSGGYFPGGCTGCYGNHAEQKMGYRKYYHRCLSMGTASAGN